MRPFRLALALLAALSVGAAAGTFITHDLTGRWTLAVVTENGTGYPVVVLKQEGDKVTGTYQSNAMGSRTLEGTVTGDTLRFTLSASMGGGQGITLTYVAHIVTPDSLNGYVDFAGMGGATLTGRREKSQPERSNPPRAGGARSRDHPHFQGGRSRLGHEVARSGLPGTLASVPP